MIRNTAGQVVGAQMVSATDGSAFTGSVTVAVTVDAGTQATGSVGSGACTHEGGGYHTYAPSQAETNGDLIAFTFSGTGAVPQTVQVYTRGALSTQEKADLNAEVDTAISDAALATASALATVDTNVNAILDDTGTSGVLVATGGISATSFAASAIDASALAATAVDEILDEAIGDSTITLRQAMKAMLAALAGKASGAATTTMTFRNVADDADVIVATVDADGNRTAVTLTV